jgi:hypothetical protein
MKTNVHFWSHLAEFLLECEIVQIKVAQKIKTHILCSVTFYENCVVYEIMWKNIVQADSARWQYGACALYAEYIGYKDILRIFNNYWFSTATTVARKRLNVTLYVHCLPCCVFSSVRTLRRTIRDLPTRVAKCTEDDDGIFERLVWTVTNLSFLCKKFIIPTLN